MNAGRILTLALVLLLALPGLALAETRLPVVEPGAPLYSNLGDEESLLAVADAMKDAGLNEGAVDAVCDWVRDYNRVEAHNPVYAIVSGFQPMTEGYVDYGDAETYAEFNFQRWKVAKLDYYDVLCRSTAYWLLRDQMSVSERIPADRWERNGLLKTDFDALFGPEDDDRITPNPALADLTEDEIAAYATLFQPIPEGGENTPEAVADAMRRLFAERGVQFPQGKAKLVTECYPAEGQLAVRHAAVLIELDTGCLLFEKYGPDYPYQATLFASAEEAGAYLCASIIAEYERFGLPAPDSVAILCNDQLIAP